LKTHCRRRHIRRAHRHQSFQALEQSPAISLAILHALLLDRWRRTSSLPPLDHITDFCAVHSASPSTYTPAISRFRQLLLDHALSGFSLRFRLYSHHTTPDRNHEVLFFFFLHSATIDHVLQPSSKAYSGAAHTRSRSWVKYFFSTCALNQNQIATLVFKNIVFKNINGTCGYQINPLDTSVKIPLVFLTECHITLTCGMVPVVSRHHVAWYLGFWCHIRLNNIKIM
jgi:hypothetical protein